MNSFSTTGVNPHAAAPSPYLNLELVVTFYAISIHGALTDGTLWPVEEPLASCSSRENQSSSW